MGAPPPTVLYEGIEATATGTEAAVAVGKSIAVVEDDAAPRGAGTGLSDPPPLFIPILFIQPC